MSKVRCKMMCEKIEHRPTSNPEDVYVQVSLRAVYNDGDKENANWAKYTPSGQIGLAITNPSAIDAFEIGKFYYVDFTPA